MLNTNNFKTIAPAVRSELRKRVHDLAVGDPLRQVFVTLFGTGTRSEQMRFYLFAAPIARKIAIERANADEHIGDTDISVSDLKMWLWWLDTMDPLCARMIDLHYFAGLSFKETAAALRLPPQAVIRELRFAKAWLQLRGETMVPE